jgi:hypothetical protein
MLNAMKQLGVLFFVVALMVASALPAFGQEAHATGLDRAREVAAQGVGTANGLANNQNATGRARAAEAIAAALGRGSGNGNAYGRGRGAAIHDILAGGDSPSEIAGEHGQTVSGMVHAYNELRKQSR